MHASSKKTRKSAGKVLSGGVFLLLGFLLIFTDCAQITSLEGGEKDTLPPVLIRSIPEEFGEITNRKKIVLTFDEYFQLNNLNSKFVSSPPMAVPKFTIKGRKLHIALKEALQDSTTYCFSFGDAIEDYHEKNVLKDFQFVFTTGGEADTLEIGGKLLDAEKMKPEKDFWVMLYSGENDSLPFKEKPKYISKTDKDGHFSLDYIREGKYRIFALKDVDGNMLYNLPNEKIAYLDSMIVPGVKAFTTTDSLKAGTILHQDGKEVGDTLSQDTVIVTARHEYFPKNIHLFSFFEHKGNQYVSDARRPIPGQCVFTYALPEDTARIRPLNFSPRENDLYIEKKDSNRLITWWLLNEKDYRKDSLQFEISCFAKDSLGQRISVRDSFTLVLSKAPDSLTKHCVSMPFASQIDSLQEFPLEFYSPLSSKIDTSKIRLYQWVDSTVTDTRQQGLLKATRPAPDLLHFALKRPYHKQFYADFIDKTPQANPMKQAGKKDTVLEYRLTDKRMIKKDSVKVVLHYDNLYFFEEIQQFSDTLSLPLLRQKLIRIDRPSEDTLIFVFNKKLSHKVEIATDDENLSGKSRVISIKHQQPEELALQLTDPTLQFQDTLILTASTIDFDPKKGKNKLFSYTRMAVFSHEKQKLVSYTRSNKKKFHLAFNLPCKKEEIQISFPGDTLPLNKLIQSEISSGKDTLFCTLLQDSLIHADSLRLTVSYPVQIQRNVYEEHTDSILLVKQAPKGHSDYRRRKLPKEVSDKQTKGRKNRRNSTVSSPKEQVISLAMPVPCTVKKDTADRRKLRIAHNWKRGKSFSLKADSFAVSDIYGLSNDTLQAKFLIKDESSLCQFRLKMKNIGRIELPDFFAKDSSKVASNNSAADSLASPADSLAKYPQITEGQLLIVLTHKNKKTRRAVHLKKDSTINLPALPAGEYTLKAIYDSNANDQWDAGNYLKKILPERILLYSEKIVLKPENENETKWEITPPKL